ncbi:MAG: hypothetical protein Q4E67_00230 [Planctomycetia bacterium]|nr:hypothetical protein [Planctomycetia bacterium]
MPVPQHPVCLSAATPLKEGNEGGYGFSRGVVPKWGGGYQCGNTPSACRQPPL